MIKVVLFEEVNGSNFLEIEPIIARDGFAIHNAVASNGALVDDQFSVTHIASGLAAGRPEATIEDAIRRMNIVIDMTINDVPIGRIGKCEVVQLMPKIAEMAAEKFSDVNLLMVPTNQKRVAETLNC